MLRATEVFLQVERERELTRIAEENLATHLKTRESVDLHVKSGVRQRADLDQAQGRVAQAQSAVSIARGRLRDAELAHQRLHGSLPGEFSVPNAESLELTRNGTIDRQAVVRTTAEAAGIADTSNPRLAIARAELALAEATLQATKAPYLPRLDLELAANRNRNISGVPGLNNTESAMLMMRWDLYRGGADSAQERASAERRFAAVDVLATVPRDIEERVALAVSQKQRVKSGSYTFAHMSSTASRQYAPISCSSKLVDGPCLMC